MQLSFIVFIRVDGGVDRHRFFFEKLVKVIAWEGCLTSEAVQSATLSLECVHDIKGSYSLPAGMLGVGDGIADDVLEEYFQDASGLFIDKAGDTLDAASSSETANCGLRNALDVVSENFAVSLGATFA